MTGVMAGGGTAGCGTGWIACRECSIVYSVGAVRTQQVPKENVLLCQKTAEQHSTGKWRHFKPLQHPFGRRSS
jgi:hypothetical protein